MTHPPPDTGERTQALDVLRVAKEQRKIDVLREKRPGVSFQTVADKLGISRQYAHELYWEGMGEVKSPAVHAQREEQNAILRDTLERAYAIANKRHLAISGTEIVRDADGKPLIDDGPELASIREIRAIVMDMAKLNGTLAPVQATINGAIRYEVAGLNLEALQ